RQDVLNRRARDGVAGGRLEQRFETDQDLRTRILEVKGELALFEHRIERHDAGAALPGAQGGENELRNVLQIQCNAVAAPDSAMREERSKSAGVVLDQPVRKDLIEIANRRSPGILAS